MNTMNHNLKAKMKFSISKIAKSYKNEAIIMKNKKRNKIISGKFNETIQLMAL